MCVFLVLPLSFHRQVVLRGLMYPMISHFFFVFSRGVLCGVCCGPWRALRVTCLAAVFLACRFGPWRLALVPTLFITFSFRWFVVTPPPPAGKRRESAAGAAGASPSTFNQGKK